MSEGLNGTAQAGLGVSPHDSAGNGVSHSVERDARDSNGGGRDVDRGVTPIPSSIVQALCQIMVTVDAVKKSQRNQHGGYNFASTDDIYAAVTRKMGEVGLILLSLEDRCEIKRVEKDGKTAQWAHMEFSFVLATTADTWTDARAKRTLYIQVTGPQTFQAAQSYVEKAYLRSLLKLPTGDMDLDSMPQDEPEDGAQRAQPAPKRKSSAEGKRDGSVAEFNKLVAAIANASNRDDLQALYMDNADSNGPWAGMPSKWAGLLQDDYDAKMEGFNARIAAE